MTRLICPLLCLLTALMSVQAATAQELSEQEYQDKLKQLQSSINQLKSELKKAKSTRDNLQGELESSEVDISELVKDIERLKEALDSGKKQITQLRSERSGLQDQQQQQQAFVEKHINAIYRSGAGNEIKLILNQEDPELLARKLKYYEYLIEGSQREIRQYLSVIDNLNAVESKLAKQIEQQQSRQAQMIDRRNQLQSQQQKRLKTIKQLANQISSQGTELKHKVQDQKRLQDLIESLSEAINDLALPGQGDSIAKSKGKLSLPVKGKLLNTFGSKRAGQNLRWDGLTIAAKAGTPVKAIHHGRVVFADYLRGQGLLLILDHGNGYLSLYGHNRALIAELGEWVNTGDVISQVGNTGGRNTEALYFEIRSNGKPQDPLRWCKRRG